MESKKFSIEEIAAYLQECLSFEPVDIPEGTGRYYLHVTWDGELVACRGDDTVNFVSDFIRLADIEDAYISACEEEGKPCDGLDSMDCIYDTEDLKYDHFREAVESLTEQVNEWLADQDDNPLEIEGNVTE